jgi:hypothetical protein
VGVVSGLRCRPGDLAVTIGVSRVFPEWTGLLCDVLYAAPLGEFILPDGERQLCGPRRSSGVPFWVVHFAKPVVVQMTIDGRPGTRLAVYGCVADAHLQPIRGQHQPEAVTTTADKPQPVEA